MAGYVSKCDFYDYIKLPIETANDSSVSDTEGYLRITKNQKGGYHGTLSVAAQSPESGHPIKWQNLIHTIGSNDNSITVTNPYPGEINLSYAGNITNSNYLDSSAIVCVLATINSSAALDSHGQCWVTNLPVLANPLYRYVSVELFDEYFNQVDPRGIYIVGNGQSILIDFENKGNYPGTQDKPRVFVRILIAKAYQGTVTNVEPSDNMFIINKNDAVMADTSAWAKSSGNGFIEVGADTIADSSTIGTASHA